MYTIPVATIISISLNLYRKYKFTANTNMICRITEKSYLLRTESTYYKVLYHAKTYQLSVECMTAIKNTLGENVCLFLLCISLPI